ncbi:lipid IV(A) 3-deoxy-D-manno-octulosonic acid transferase [Arenimonas sp.]|uniref:lipid IV(A) 3-deoxy-D-manno-octulosonic acid transferase n=1 Tax=Arenimonas sp. TaxID=1872635 RepID=UPI0039E3F6B7
MKLDFSERLLLMAYSLAMSLLVPLTLVHLFWRGRGQRAYWRRWDERFALYREPGLRECLWLHAVSVGEVNAAAPLLDRLRQRYPQLPVLVTTTTPTGSERARAIWKDGIRHVYLPYDTPGAVRHFLDQFRPRIAIVMETEIWPCLFVEIGRRGIPLLIVNARLSERSLSGYAPIRRMLRIALRAVRDVLAQTPADLARYRQLGLEAERGRVLGNLKYDIALPEEFAARMREERVAWGDRPVWIAASTHPDEEQAVLAAHRQVLARFPHALLLWAPRHPERFSAAIGQAEEAGLQVAHRREHRWPSADTQCFVIDTLGELVGFYACADVAFVGGSLQAIGGHNVLEPAALGVPALVGPHTFNFQDVTELLLEAGGLGRIEDADSLAREVIALFADERMRRERGEAARTRALSERGALDRTLRVIEERMGSAN